VRSDTENRSADMRLVIRMAATLTPVEQLAEALFASSLQPSDEPTAEQVREAIMASVAHFGGFQGCAVACAEEFGDHPEVAVDRMRWALRLATV
jgi:hypothetical protein